MKRYMKLSVHINNCSDIDEKFYYFSFKEKTQSINRSVEKYRIRCTTRLSYQETQTMWKTKLPLYRGRRASKLLSLCEYAWNKTYHDLYFLQKQSYGREGFVQLSKDTKDYGNTQRYQSRALSSKRTFIKEKRWSLKWKHPP